MEGGNTCRYGSVVGIDALMHADSTASSVALNSINSLATPAAAAIGACDECEQRIARVECDECGLVYCTPCDAHRHRKGKLIFHQRQNLPITATDTIESDRRASSLAPAATSTHLPVQPPVTATNTPAGARAWSVAAVHDWLVAHDLALFTADVATHHVDGAYLLSSRMDELVEAHASASRGLKKKLLREVQKLRSDQPDVSSPSPSYTDNSSTTASNNAVTPLATRRMSTNLRVTVDPRASASSSSHHQQQQQQQTVSPVTALRSRLTQGGDTNNSKGRVSRRRVSTPSPFDVNLTASSPLALDVADAALLWTPPPSVRSVPAPFQLRPAAVATTNNSSRSDLRAMRQALGGLNLDLLQVKKDGMEINKSFDFTAEGRLQTQGFEIHTHGITNAPFPLDHHPTTHASAGFETTHPTDAIVGTRAFLVVLNELGHGASGKVYKALYMPTLQLVAVKVIRVFDQKKRHQMVRELQSLYVNFVAIANDTKAAACDELVVFYDAFTNPEIGSVSIVLEFMDRGSLEDVLQTGKRVSEKTLARMARCVLRGLAFLHEQHQLHRDIKLSNMLLNHDGRVKISDFGISRDLESTLAKATTFTGTLLYMAPERISGGTYSYPSDIWSFGLAIMALAIGKLPVPTKDGYWGVVHAVQEQPSPRLRDFGDAFSVDLCDFLDQCLQKNPMCRPSAAALLEHPFLVAYANDTDDTTEVEEGETDDQNDMTKRLDELAFMATQARDWCQTHAALLHATQATNNNVVLMQRTSNAMRIDALATQLRLPHALVADAFAFLDDYC